MKSKYSKLPKWKRDAINRIKALNRFIDKLKVIQPIYEPTRLTGQDVWVN